MALIFNICLTIVFGLLFLLNTYQSILDFYLTYKVGNLVYYFHRILVCFNFFPMIEYIIISTGLVYIDAYLLFSEILFDIAILFGYTAIMNLAYQTSLSYQIALKMKIDRNEANNTALLHIMMLVFQTISCIIKIAFVAIYDTKFYSGYYLIVCALVMAFMVISSWSSFYKLNIAINESSASNVGYKVGTDTTSNQIDSFKLFLIYFSIGLGAAFFGMIYEAYSYFTHPVKFYDPELISDIQFLPVIAALCSLIATIYFWKSINASVSPEASYYNDSISSRSDPNIQQARLLSLSNARKISISKISDIKSVENNKVTYVSEKYLIPKDVDLESTYIAATNITDDHIILLNNSSVSNT